MTLLAEAGVTVVESPVHNRRHHFRHTEIGKHTLKSTNPFLLPVGGAEKTGGSVDMTTCVTWFGFVDPDRVVMAGHSKVMVVMPA